MMESKSYGLPYKGSKNRIAKWVVSVLPANHTLVDLFAGGCAVSHCAMLSGKFKRVIANDICDAPELFADAVNGNIDISRFPLTREDFKASTDTLSQLVYSFGNNRQSYIYGRNREEVCNAAENVIYGKTIADRYVAYRKFIKTLSSYSQCGNKIDRKISELEAIERVNRLEAIERVERLQEINGTDLVAKLETARLDYRDFDVPANSTVYVDPPYKGTTIEQYGVDFDYGAFENWLAEVDFPVFVSEYTCPDGCVEVASKKTVSIADTSNNKRVVEKIFVQRRFYD